MSFRAGLRVSRGKLVEQGGAEVHAASWLRRRHMVLDADLLRHPGERKRILVHELFHFVWLRLGNPARAAWSGLLERERAHGELGWSAEWRKQALRDQDRRRRSRRWRDYICESFCDTAAWLYAGVREHEEFTLAQRARAGRRKYFEGLTAGRPEGLRI